MSKLFDWFKSEEKTPQIEDMLASGRAKLAELETARTAVVADAADGDAEAQTKYRQIKAELATITADVELLQAALAEHGQRAARQQAERRKAAHAERVAAVKADLEASHAIAAELQHHLALAVAAYDKLLATRRSAMNHTIKLPDYAEVQTGQTREAVGQELYRVGARLNSVSINQMGFPGPSVIDGRLASRPDKIEPLADRFKRVDAYTLGQLESSQQ